MCEPYTSYVKCFSENFGYLHSTPIIYFIANFVVWVIGDAYSLQLQTLSFLVLALTCTPLPIILHKHVHKLLCN